MVTLAERCITYAHIACLCLWMLLFLRIMKILGEKGLGCDREIRFRCDAEAMSRL